MAITSKFTNYSMIHSMINFLGDHLRVVCGATENNPHGILDHHMLVIAVLDNATLQVIHYTGEEEEKIEPTVQEDPSEDSIWNRLTNVFGGIDDTTKNESCTHDPPPPAEDSMWSRLTGVLGGTEDTAKSESRTHDPPPAENSMWNRLTGVLGGTEDTAKSESRTHDPPPAEDSVWNRLTGVLGGTEDTAKSESRAHDPPPAEDSVWNRLTGVLGGTEDTAKSESRAHDPPPAEDNVRKQFTSAFGGTNDTAEHQEQCKSHAHDERTRGGGMVVREQKVRIDVKAEKVELLKYPEKENLKLYSPDEAIKRARSRLDEKEYGLFQNNCECFVNWAITGESISNQVESGKWATALGAMVGAVSGYRKEGSLTAVAKGAVSGAQEGFQHYRENRY